MEQERYIHTVNKSTLKMSQGSSLLPSRTPWLQGLTSSTLICDPFKVIFTGFKSRTRVTDKNLPFAPSANQELYSWSRQLSVLVINSISIVNVGRLTGCNFPITWNPLVLAVFHSEIEFGMTTLKNSNICNHILTNILIVGCVSGACDQQQYPLA